MNFRFVHTYDPSGMELRLLNSDRPVPVDLWAVAAPDALLPGIELAKRLEAAGSALADETVVLIDHHAVAGLSAGEANSIALPSLTDHVLSVSSRGVITKPDYRVDMQWMTPLGHPVLAATRVGAFLRIGEKDRRISDALLDISEAIDALNKAMPDDLGGRFAALATLRDVLPAGSAEGTAQASGLIAKMTIAVADAFSLDLVGEGGAAQLVPILQRAHADDKTQLLSGIEQKEFGEKQFNGFSEVRSVYTLGAQRYVVIQPTLRRALAEVKRVNSATTATKRSFMSNPRGFLREALGDEVDDIVLETIFRETPAYADRVLGLGLWMPRVVPWIKLATTDWFGRERDDVTDGGDRPDHSREPVTGGIRIGDRLIPLDPDEARDLATKVENAIGSGQKTVPHKFGDETITVLASHDTLKALATLEQARADANKGAKGVKQNHPEVLLILPNEAALDLEEDVKGRRAGLERPLPNCLATPLKEHQAEGLRWLQGAWLSGLPGVLLADDMGLGKTLQGLTFFAWLREGMREKAIPKAPVLIVAPTGLLQNWRAEHDRHLSAPGLGICTEAFGRGLSLLKRLAEDNRPSLDITRLAQSDWILTTYETLRDYDRDFGQIQFAALLFDEAQKIKTPSVRITDAAKAMKADFRIAMTGTPVENRLSDLWCIVDTVHPGRLDDLKGFSARYERDLNAETLQGLREQLERSLGGYPKLMMRRMKEDRLPDLPQPDYRKITLPMPPSQRAAYDKAISQALQADAPGAVLKALHELRAISLHPAPDDVCGDDAFIAGSARLQGAFQTLDKIAEAGEHALIFLTDLKLQARLAGIVQRRYSLPAAPMIINGSVAGGLRQARVDTFQKSTRGFDVMILSPQAGGVGLTLTRANHVIHLSRWWNPAVEDQCTGRIFRIGQTRSIFVHIPLAVTGGEKPSFDQNLDSLLERKRKLMRATLMPPDAHHAAECNELYRTTVG